MIPADESEWRDLVRSGMPPCWRHVAEGSGGSVFENGDIFAAIVPRAPDRSVFNSVFYEDGERLLGSLDRIDQAYAEAGVNAWTVWVPEADAEIAAGLERAGHKLDATPRYMGMELSELREPERDPGLEIREREDYERMAQLNEIAYGYPPGDFGAVADATMAGLRIYFGVVDGAEAATCATWAHGDDAAVLWVAVAPEGRGRGVSGRLMASALVDARERGLKTTTLQSTKLGYPVYERLGYRDFGEAQMWERRKPKD